MQAQKFSGAPNAPIRSKTDDTLETRANDLKEAQEEEEEEKTPTRSRG